MDKIKNLITQIAFINNKNTELLDATGGRFNMFRVCGVNHYENTHSAIIAEFLNTNGTHGLKSKFLESFIETLGESFTTQDFDCKNTRIRTEYSTEEGRIDILIENDQNKAIIIENKVYAKDQPEQLKRYNKYAQTYKNGYQIIYLTLFGTEASPQSGEGVSYLPISYREEIINWLEKCVAIASRTPIVRETIIQYINHIKQLTNQDMNTKNKEEITEFLSKIENLRAAKTVYQNYSETFNYLAQKYFNPIMEEYAIEKGLTFHYERSEESYIRFYFTSTNWQGKYWIGFTVEGNRCHYGLCNKINVYRISDENRRLIHQKLNDMGVNPRKESEWWPFYAFIPNLSIDNWEADIVNSNTFANNCKEKIGQILSAIEGIKF